MPIYLKLVIGTIILINEGSFSEYRQVIIFGNDQHKQLIKQQLTLFKEVQKEMSERDIKILVVERQSALYQKYKIKPQEFAIILLGKDNTEKLRTYEIIMPVHLFKIIDAMPMRRQEMLKKKSD